MLLFFAAYLIPAVVAVTSILTIGLGVRFAGLSAGCLKQSAIAMLQSVGLTAFFYILNTIAAFLLIEAGRRVSGRFISHYFATGGVMLWLSLFQALVFRNWIASAPRPRIDPPKTSN